MTYPAEEMERIFREIAVDKRCELNREAERTARELINAPFVSAAVRINTYADHDGDCAGNLGQDCSCGYSEAVRTFNDQVAALEP